MLPISQKDMRFRESMGFGRRAVVSIFSNLYFSRGSSPCKPCPVFSKSYCPHACRIGRLRDPNRPKKLTEEQALQVRQGSRILELVATRDRLRAKILADFGVIKMAVGEAIYEDYQVLGRLLNSIIRAEERALLKVI